MNDGTKVIDDLISVVVPVYNVEKYVGQCIESIINQTYKNLEIILVDDGSTDNSGKICDEYAKKDSRIKVIHKENGGLVSARKAGLNIANGGSIGFVDSDDWIDPKMYGDMQALMNKYKVDFVVSGYYRMNGEKWKPCDQVRIIDNPYKEDQVWESIICDVKNGIYFVRSICFKLMRSNILKKAYTMLPDKCSLGEDYITTVNAIFMSKRVCLHNEAYYHYMRRENSYVSTFNLKRVNQEIMLLEELENVFRRNNAEYLIEKYLKNAMSKDIVNALNNSHSVSQVYLKNTEQLVSNAQQIQNIDRKGDKNKMKNTGWYHCFPFGSVEKNSNIAIYGMGEIGRHYLKQLEETGYCKVECASDGNWQNISDVNVKMVSPEELAKMDLTVIIANGNADVANQIINRLKELGMSEERIIWEDYNIMDEVETDIYTKKQQGNVTRYNGKYHLFPFEKVEKNEKIIIWGMGAVGESYNLQVNQTGYCDIAYDVYADWDKIKDHKVVIASDDYHEAQRLIKQFKDWGVEEKNIIWNDHLVSEMMVINVKVTPQAPKKEAPAPAPATPRQTVQNNKPKVKLIIPKTELANIVKLLMNEGNREIEIECK